MKQLLLLLVAGALVLALWAVLVAPDYDLDPGTLQGKQLAALLSLALVAAAVLLRPQSGWLLAPHAHERPLDVGPPAVIDLICSRIC